MKQKIRYKAFAIGGFFFIADQCLKLLARGNSLFTFHILKNQIGWEYFTNRGIAFGIYMPAYIIIIFSIIIIAALLLFFTQTKNKTLLADTATALILAGAVSNLIDRMAFGFTIDYIRMFTTVINLADISIIIGAALIIINEASVRNVKK